MSSVVRKVAARVGHAQRVTLVPGYFNDSLSDELLRDRKLRPALLVDMDADIYLSAMQALVLLLWTTYHFLLVLTYHLLLPTSFYVSTFLLTAYYRPLSTYCRPLSTVYVSTFLLTTYYRLLFSPLYLTSPPCRLWTGCLQRG